MNTTSSPLYQVHQHGDIHIVEFLQENLDPVAVEEIKIGVSRMVKGAGEGGDAGAGTARLAGVSGVSGGINKWVLDLSRVRYVPSRLLGVLLEANQLITEQHGQMRVCGLQPMILDVFKFMRLDTVLKVVATREDAIKSLSNGGQ